MNLPEIFAVIAAVAGTLVTFAFSLIAVLKAVVKATPSPTDDVNIDNFEMKVLSLIYKIESTLNKDIDGDGQIGKPEKEALLREAKALKSALENR